MEPRSRRGWGFSCGPGLVSISDARLRDTAVVPPELLDASPAIAVFGMRDEG